MRYSYQYEPDDNGTWLITAPDFPEVTTFSEPNVQDAKRRALDAIETAIQGRMTDRTRIPEGSSVRNDEELFVPLPTSTVLKVRLHNAMLDAGIRKAELGRRLKWHAPQVDRLFAVEHETRLGQFDQAFRALNREIDIIDRPIP